VRGFAVGRSIFWGAAKQWFAGDLDDDGAIAGVRTSYEQVIASWRARAL
jgi:5-dehydro-2-deoxygluconokinase